MRGIVYLPREPRTAAARLAPFPLRLAVRIDRETAAARTKYTNWFTFECATASTLPAPRLPDHPANLSTRYPIKAQFPARITKEDATAP